VNEPSGLLRLSSIGFSLFYFKLVCILRSMDLYTVSDYSILSTNLVFPFLLLFDILFFPRNICFCGIPVTLRYFSLSDTVFLER